MVLTSSKTKKATTYYVTKAIYNGGKRTSKVIERLGTLSELENRFGSEDAEQKAKEYVKELTRQEKLGRREILVKYSPTQLIEKETRHLYSGGYLFLQEIYYELWLDKVCRKITEKYKFDYDLDVILSRLVYGRILFPASKLATHELSKRYLQSPSFELQHMYRGLAIIAKETDFIQAELYKNSKNIINRKTGILYYDCTNYFFELEQEEGLKQYGFSKEHRPNPIVEMGLFMDGDGLPLAFTINAGNTNEQLTLKPLEKKILADFELSKFVVCTDAGLSSIANRKYNNIVGRAFITTQSIKKLKRHLRNWALDTHDWHLTSTNEVYDIALINEENHKDSTFYKERWIKEDDLEQKLIVTYSIKYRDYQRSIRWRQVERAKRLIETNPTRVKKVNQNDYKRFISRKNVTNDGEVAEREMYSIDTLAVEAEEIFDGFYAVCTNLEDKPEAIININHRRWEIEECFSIIKSEFKARPVYLQRDDRIKAHFTTCFISLLIYRILEKKLDDKFTSSQIIYELRDMNFLEVKGEGYIPAYTRTSFTDELHEVFGFRTDYCIVSNANMKNIFKLSSV